MYYVVPRGGEEIIACFSAIKNLLRRKCPPFCILRALFLMSKFEKMSNIKPFSIFKNF